MFFAKGEIIMNNIYKVIWSKAKNCYVVASEIARSHTKSATGSEKIGGVTRRSLLASLMALSLLCGGLGVASAADGTVNVDESTPGTAVVYTKEGTESYVQGELSHYAKASDTFTKSQTFTQDQVRKLINDLKTGDVATNRADITALQSELGNKADESTVATALDGKANKADVYSRTEVDTAVANAVTTAGTNVDNKLTDYYNKAAVDGKIADEENARNNAITTAIGQERDARNTAITTAINGEVSERNQAIHTAITQEVTNRDAAVTNAKTELQGKITEEETARKEADTAFNTRLTTAEGKIGANETAIGDLKAADTALEGKITKNREDIATLNGKVATAEGNITDLKAKDIDLEGKIQTNANNIETNKNAISDINKRTAGIDRIDARHETTIEGHVTVDDHGNVTAEGKLKGEGVDAGAVNAGSLQVDNASHLKGDVTMDNKLSVTGDTTLKKTDVDGTLNVTGESSLKNTKVDGMLTTTGKATFQEAVEMDKGLTVTNGDTTLKGTKVDGKLTVTDEADLKNTKVDGTLGVTGETTLDDKLTVKGEATFEKNVTAEKDLTVKGTLNTKDVAAETIHISKSEDTTDYKSEGSIIGDGGKLSVSNEKTDKRTNITEKSELNVNEKGTVNWATSTDVTGNVTEGRSEVTADNIKNSVMKTEGGKTFGYEENITEAGKVGTATDKDGNRNELTQTATGTENTVTSKDGNKSTTKQEAGSISSTVYDKDGNVKASSEMKEDGSISNNATGDMTNIVGGKLTTTVTGQATEEFKGGLNTTVTGAENHTVTGKQTNTVGGGQINNITGDQTTTVTDGNISNTAKNITNKANEKLTDEVGDNTRVTTSTSITDSVGATTNRKIEDGKITDTAGDFTVTTEKTKGTTFAKTGSTTAFSTEAGAPTDTNIAGNLITTGRVDANELGVSDKDGANSADLSVEAREGKGVKASAGNGTTTGSLDVKADEVSSSVKDASGKGSTFKQRIDKIMMESKDVSIKAEETLTNEAKVITNKASEVINNEAVNINNTATGIITSKASEIKNQADKLISNKVGENTWENMENGKITTSIKDGAKQNLTQSNAAGTTQSTVDVGKSTVTIQNADGLVDVVTDGTNTSVQNQTASQIAADVKDGAGNENASVANATISANTIKSGSKANTVISTADGTSFINSEAAAPVTGASGAGTAVNTTIKGNTITTGKVTMDYAEVMKDLGVRGNANITGKTTTGSLEVTGTSTLKGDVTMESNATVNGNFSVGGNTNLKNTEVDGTLNVTQKATFGDSVSIAKDLSVGGDVTANSYKVGDKTYIDANGINANDQKITNVADGSISEGSKDAVNGGQLYGVKRDLEHQVDKVGANAAAMANLRPMEFDPSSKWNIAAAIGNYGSETAAALGAFYRPNDDVMVNLSTAFGTGENMVGGGVSVRLGKGGNKLSREENNALKDQVNDLTARMDALLSVLNPNMSKDFPDVPENHWAYEAVSRLAGNDIVQGYPDGEFHGERTMTRYEMAEIIYNALSRGAEAERELVEEFKPELQAMAASEKATAEKAEG